MSLNKTGKWVTHPSIWQRTIGMGPFFRSPGTGPSMSVCSDAPVCKTRQDKRLHTFQPAWLIRRLIHCWDQCSAAASAQSRPACLGLRLLGMR